MNDKELSALKALAEVATPGPWFVQQGDDYNFMNMTAISTEDRGTRHLGQLTDDSLLAVTFHQSQPWVAYELDDLGDANSAYIAAANPTAILSLISRIEQQAARIAELESQQLAGAAKDGNTSVYLSGLTRYGWREAYIGDDSELIEDASGTYVRFEDVQVLLATPARDVGGLTDDLIDSHIIKSGVMDKSWPTQVALHSFARAIEREALATSPAPSVKQEAMLVPKWAGKFSSHADWVNRAKRVLSVPSHKPPAVCVDAKGRRCFIGADMARARDEDAFPVRYFWECELAAPSASQGEVKVPEGFARVPKDPTPEMVHAARFYSGELPTTAATCYRAMIAAATAPSVMDGEKK